MRMNFFGGRVMAASGWVLLLFFSCLLFSGCGYMKMTNRKLWAVVSPTPENVKKGNPEDCVLLNGRVDGRNDAELPLEVIVMSVTDAPSGPQIMDHATVSRSGHYFLYLPAGRYKLLVFADLDHNGFFDAHEWVGRYHAETIEVKKSKSSNGVISGLNILIDPNSLDPYPRSMKLRASPLPKLQESSRLPAEITRLSDKRFLLQNGAQWLYQPAAFFERGNGFFYLLEEDDPTKIPVIFVHGAGGTPLNWHYLTALIDKSRFQPWFFYYPSGLSLDTTAEIFLDTVLAHTAGRNTPVIIAAHSMGGLIARTALSRAQERGDQVRPGMFISFCTPYRGVRAASKVSNLSPVVLPSWKDIAAQSPFITGLFQKPLPPGQEFYLFFTYQSDDLLSFGNNNDGAITLESQLAIPAQEEAKRVWGFNETHYSILTSPAAGKVFLKQLDTSYHQTINNKIRPDIRP